jgi:hypothetical protein
MVASTPAQTRILRIPDAAPSGNSGVNSDAAASRPGNHSSPPIQPAAAEPTSAGEWPLYAVPSSESPSSWAITANSQPIE